MKGKVCLVGAGPGDPELLTLKAAERLRSADIVLHDALVSAEVLARVAPSARIINTGKRCGPKSITQAEINGLLIDFALQGNFVVRLKSGDPLLFGRAGEELEALRRASIEVEVVPGITSALAAASAAQISLSDRHTRGPIVFISGHHALGKQTRVRWDKIPPGSTVVVYMPGEPRALAENLLGAGLDRLTPCIVVSNAGLAHECCFRTRLEGLFHSPAFPAPSLLIIGETVGAPLFEKLHPPPPSGCEESSKTITFG